MARTARTLHSVDIENLLGTPAPSTADVEHCRAEYLSRFVNPGDLVVLACSHRAYATVGFVWRAARHLLRSGPDGADLELLGVIADERVEERFPSVVLASGDGIFTEAVAWLAGQGVHVTVISRPGALARRLRLAAGTTYTVELAQVSEVSA